MAKNYQFKNLDIVNTLFLTLTPLAALVFTTWWLVRDGFDVRQVYLMLTLYFISGFSITAGYHRLFSHRAYDANNFVKFLFLVFGAAAFQNSVYKWGADHRVHHNKVDTDEDPYNIQEGFFFAHMGWVMLKANARCHEKYVRDLQKDPIVMWQHKYYLIISVLVGFLMPTLIGGLFFDSYLGGFALGGLGKIVLIHHCTFFINSLCHYVGSTPYTKTNSAKDSWYMAFFTFGEGYHNFHHYFQTDYRNGVRWYQFDPTKWLIKTLEQIGMASKLKLTPPEKILNARLQMKIEMLRQQKKIRDEYLKEFEALKAKILVSLERFQNFKAELQAERTQRNQEIVRDLKLRMELARLDFEHAYKQWQLQLSLVGA